jgi:hypothetical protein
VEIGGLIVGAILFFIAYKIFPPAGLIIASSMLWAPSVFLGAFLGCILLEIYYDIKGKGSSWPDGHDFY